MELLTLFGVLAVGSLTFWAFWAAFVVCAIVLAMLTEAEHWGWSTTIIIIGFVAMGAVGIFNVWQYTTVHPWLLVRDIGAYLGGGIVWATFKWWRYVSKSHANYLTARDKFVKDNGGTSFTAEMRIAWTERLNTYGSNRICIDGEYETVDNSSPLARNHKEKITNWLAFWPFSLIGTLFNDFLRELWDAIYDAIAGVFDSISKAVFKDVAGDIATAEEIKAAKKATEDASKKSPPPFNGPETNYR